MSMQCDEYSISAIRQLILKLLATTCNIPIEEIKTDSPVIELGFDSMLAANINMQLEQQLGESLPFEQIANNASIDEIAQYIYQQRQELSNISHQRIEEPPIRRVDNSSFEDLPLDMNCQQPLWSVENSSSEARRPAACPRDPEIVLNVQHDCIERDRTGSRGQAAGRRNMNCQHAIVKSILDDSVCQLEGLDRRLYDIRSLAQYKKIILQKTLFKRANVELPYYRSFSSASTDTIQFENRQLINFSSYNYLGYNNDPRVNKAAQDAITQYGTSACSSRIVSGEKGIHRELESAIAELHQVDDALAFVSGYTTNVTVIGHMMERGDLIIHDNLAHNSIVMGSNLSKAKRLKFPHNDTLALENILKEHRLKYERVLIITEGLYSMDGDIVPLAEIVALKKQYKCLLMVDEAHSIGVLGENGLGVREHAKVLASDVDIWMGTLSKSFAGCGGYIAGCSELIDYLKFSVPGMIFSVGMAPALAAASLKAIELLKEDNAEVKRLQENSQYFLSKAKEKGLNTGLAAGYAIIPIIIGQSLKTALLANKLFQQGINVQSITYPGVDELSARLRFFISALHTKYQINHAIGLLETL